MLALRLQTDRDDLVRSRWHIEQATVSELAFAHGTPQGMVRRVFAHAWIVTPPLHWRRSSTTCNRTALPPFLRVRGSVRCIDGTAASTFRCPRGRIRSPLPKCAGPVEAIIDEADIAPANSLHDSSDLSAARWCREQVDVIGHVHIGVHCAIFLRADLTQVVEVAQSVNVGKSSPSDVPIRSVVSPIKGCA